MYDGHGEVYIPSSARDLANTAEMHSGADLEGTEPAYALPIKSVLPDV